MTQTATVETYSLNASDVDDLQHLCCPTCDPDRALCGYSQKSPYYRRHWSEVPKTRLRCAVCWDLRDPHVPHIKAAQ